MTRRAVRPTDSLVDSLVEHPRNVGADSVAGAVGTEGVGTEGVGTAGVGTVGIVGGGLAGLAAAVRLVDAGLRVDVFESRRVLGGRAGSFIDQATGEEIDHCQHVAMGCCTELLDLFQRTGLEDAFRRDVALHFFGPDGRRHDLSAAPLLPAPLHLAPSLLGLSYLAWRDRWKIAWALRRLTRLKPHDVDRSATFGEWLRANGQSESAIRQFWSVVVVSALSDTVDVVSIGAAQKVFVDAFLAGRDAYHVLVPRLPLATLSRRLADWIAARGGRTATSSPVTRVVLSDGRVNGIQLSSQTVAKYDAVVVAVPWHSVRRLFDDVPSPPLPWLESLERFTPAAIHSLHLWFDGEWLDVPHAVLIDRLSQWVFRHDGDAEPRGTYCQVVISAAHAMSERDGEAILHRVLAELHEVWPSSRAAHLVRWRLVRQPLAVFSPRPDVESLRPPQRTSIANLALAGDWTDTGWPATMESAVRSGRRAADALLDYFKTASNNL